MKTKDVVLTRYDGNNDGTSSNVAPHVMAQTQESLTMPLNEEEAQRVDADAADIEEILSAAGADDVAQDDVSLIPADNYKQSGVTGQLLELATHLFEISNILISYPVKF